jgi:hypothetical protein
MTTMMQHHHHRQTMMMMMLHQLREQTAMVAMKATATLMRS